MSTSVRLKDSLVPILMSISMISGFAYFSSGITLWITFIPGVLIALLFYFLTFYRKSYNPDKILPIYWLAIAVQFLHFSEEYLGDFNSHFPALFDSPEYTIDFFVVFNMVAYSLFVLGGLIIQYQKRHLMIIPLFFILFGTIGNAIGHSCFSLMVEGYFPGLYTSFLYWILGPLLIRAIFQALKEGT